MPVPKWFIIAKNEYRIVTSSVRKYRLYLPFLVIALIALTIGLVMPFIVNALTSEIEAFFASIVAVAMVQILLFMLFFYFLTFPISLALRETQTDQNEIFLSAPVSPSDVLLGKFMGMLPFYTIAIMVIAGIFTAVLDPLGLDIAQKLIVIIIFIFTCLIGLWLGTIITAILRTRLGKTARGRDIGKALSIIIALPMLAIFYAIMGGGLLDALANPNTNESVRSYLDILPSSWGAKVIIEFALHPGNIGAIWLETLTRVGGLILFFIIILWLGFKLAGWAYSLEQPGFSSGTVGTNGVFYKTINTIGGRGSFGILLVSMFKDYGRRLQNITWIIYIVGIMVLMFVFINDPQEEPEGVVILSHFLFPMLAAVVVGDVTIRGKENLFIFRKAPNGENQFVKARLLQSCLVVVPVVICITIISLALAPNITILRLFSFTGYSILTSIGFTAFALGMFLVVPAFSEKSSEFISNIMILSMVSSFSFLAFIIIFDLIVGMVLFLIMIWVIGFSVLLLGSKNLSRIE
jgi:hypothetical protein